MRDAITLLESLITRDDHRTRSLYFVNANTLNVASDDPSYRDVLNSADYVFGDGTGVRWAARLQGVRLRANLNGTDLMPALFQATGGRGYRYYLLGATDDVVRRAADHATMAFSGWTGVGYHHGYFRSDEVAAVIKEINQAAPHVLLTGMGSPLQERWIAEHRKSLRVPLCIGVGGLYSHWSGDLVRAPRQVRKQGFEWLHTLAQQPYKARRYLLGNPRFLYRIIRDRLCHGRSD